MGRGSCHLWDVMNDRSWGGVHPGACRDSRPDPCNDHESGRKREKERQINREREMWPVWRKEKRDKRKREERKEKKKRGSTCFNFSRQRDEGHGRRGRWVSEWEWSIIYLSSIFLTLIPLSFFPSVSLFPRLCPAVSSFSWECSEGK